MKKAYSNMFFIYLSIFAVVFFSAFSITCVVSLINNIKNDQTNMIIANLILLVGFVFFIFLSLLVLNRCGCKVIYDEKRKKIIRKGFIFGYKYELKIEDIQGITIISLPRDAVYYVFIDTINTKYDGGYKKSFIRIEKNEKNLKFIKQFWDKPIKNN